MRGIRQTIGVGLLFLVASPFLLAAIFTTGLTLAATSEDFYRSLSQKVVQRLPFLVQDAFAAARQPGAVQDPDTRAWISAMAKAQTQPVEMLKQTGIQTWLDEEVAGGIEAVGGFMSGTVDPSSVTLDLRPLKSALAGPAMRGYLDQVFQHLPACDQAGRQRWQRRLQQSGQDKALPACNPGAQAIDNRADWLAARIARIPDQSGELVQMQPFTALEFVLTIQMILWLVMLIPALFVALGAGLAAHDGRGFLRCSGTTFLAGGLFSSLLAAMAGPWFFSLMYWHPFAGNELKLFGSEAGRLLAQQLAATAGVFLQDLFAPVLLIGLLTAGLGLVLWVLSFLIKRDPAVLAS